MKYHESNRNLACIGSLNNYVHGIFTMFQFTLLKSPPSAAVSGETTARRRRPFSAFAVAIPPVGGRNVELDRQVARLFHGLDSLLA